MIRSYHRPSGKRVHTAEGNETELMEERQMAKALILWSSRTGNTTRIADHIAEGLRDAGCEVEVRDVKYVESETEAAGYDALVLGSSNYHGEMRAYFLPRKKRARNPRCV